MIDMQKFIDYQKSTSQETQTDQAKETLFEKIPGGMLKGVYQFAVQGVRDPIAAFQELAISTFSLIGPAAKALNVLFKDAANDKAQQNSGVPGIIAQPVSVATQTNLRLSGGSIGNKP